MLKFRRSARKSLDTGCVCVQWQVRALCVALRGVVGVSEVCARRCRPGATVHRNVKNEMRGRVIVAHGSRSNYDMVN